MVSLSVASQVARRDFSAKTLRALAKRGIEVIGSQLLPVNGSWVGADVGYVVSDNGTARVWTFFQILGAAK